MRFLKQTGAVDWDRTSDLLVTNELLCQLSYNGVFQDYTTVIPRTENISNDI